MIRGVRRQMASCLLVGLALGWAAPARADDPDALIDQGLELREHGKDADALALFERAYSASPTPRAKAQIALAEQALGRWAAAEKDLVAGHARLAARRRPRHARRLHLARADRCARRRARCVARRLALRARFGLLLAL